MNKLPKNSRSAPGNLAQVQGLTLKYEKICSFFDPKFLILMILNSADMGDQVPRIKRLAKFPILN